MIFNMKGPLNTIHPSIFVNILALGIKSLVHLFYKKCNIFHFSTFQTQNLNCLENVLHYLFCIILFASHYVYSTFLVSVIDICGGILALKR